MEERLHGLVKQQMKIMRSRHRVLEHSLQDTGIHSGQHFALMYISEHTGVGSQAKLAEILNVTPASIARTMKSLEAGGYIRRSDALDDSRRNEITITEKGRRVVESGRRAFDRLNKAAFEGFSEEELSLLARMQVKMIQNIDSYTETEMK